jgi:hypothetical protein
MRFVTVLIAVPGFASLLCGGGGCAAPGSALTQAEFTGRVTDAGRQTWIGR